MNCWKFQEKEVSRPGIPAPPFIKLCLPGLMAPLSKARFFTCKVEFPRWLWGWRREGVQGSALPLALGVLWSRWSPSLLLSASSHCSFLFPSFSIFLPSASPRWEGGMFLQVCMIPSALQPLRHPSGALASGLSDSTLPRRL